ncbi:vWA domain-containing protein [Polyangium jinanense]|uniref:VWA domain-containing protein n=1 Tax=Polyangium jinanense TaxID=2829994 RepID=A0A9X3X3R1_9BACT|nr:VWA domain-containing protein [Polyangium jinanense]MDC3955417.1 VWA domain-containing protein [Polyangium jinanense]MDC3981718.1 VWA domain-containing protein [Polyangium jinanense]
MRDLAFRTSIPLLLVAAVLFVLGCGPAASPSGARDPNAVRVEALLGSPMLLANGDSTVYAVLRLSTAPRPARERGPVNVALAIDTSGSMEGEGIVAARRASLQVIDSLKDGDRLAVVVFHSKAEVLIPSTELDDEVRQEARQRITAMEARGTTEMAGGLQTALDEVLANYNPNGVNRVVLLGDGIPNQAASLEYNAKRAAERGVAVTTLGLGLDYDETLMGKLASLSGGRYRYIESADKLAGFFREELDRLDTVYGRKASVTLTPGPGVRIDAIVGGEMVSPGSAAAYLPLGDIVRGDSRDVVVRMTVTPRKAGVPIELLDAVLTFDDALEQAGRLERRLYLGARTTLDEGEVAKAKNPAVELSAALAEASATTLQALELGKQGAYVRARGMLEQGAATALAQSKRTPSAELEKLAANMTSVAKDMPEADRPVPKASSGEYSFEFSDDAMSAPMPMPSEAPSVVRKRKEVHQKAVDALY